MKSALNLHVERLEKPSAISFDVRSQAVKNWVEALPMGHIGEATRQIYTALRETNGLEIDPKLRFELLEALWQPVHTILPALFRHFSGNQFPLPKKAQKVAQLSTDLQAELLLGYRLALDGRDNSSWFGRKAQKKQKATCAHRLLHYLQGVLENYRMLNLAAPRGLWREAHRVYIEAGQMGFLDDPVEVPGQQATPLSREYKQMVLITLLPAHLLRPEQMDLVRRSMGTWTTDLKLSEPSKELELRAPYCVLLHMDMPPLANDGRCQRLRNERASALMLDPSRIRTRIEGLLASNAATVQVEGVSLAADTAGALLRNWGAPPARTEVRIAQDLPVDVAIGLSAVHYLMRHRNAEEAGIPTLHQVAAKPARSPKPQSAEAQPAAPSGNSLNLSFAGQQSAVDKPKMSVRQGEFISSQEQNDDETWAQVYDQSVIAPKNWTEVGEEKAYLAVPGKVLDASDNGYRIGMPVSKVEQLKVGDLLGVIGLEGQSWRIGSTRWVRQEGDRELQVGVQVHMSDAVPLQVKVRHGGTESAPQRCLLGFEGSGSALILLPSLPGIHEKRLTLTDGSIEAGLRLGEKVAGSALFEAYRFEISGAKIVADMRDCPDQFYHMVERFLPPDQSEQGSQPQPRVAAEDEYSNIWSAL